MGKEKLILRGWSGSWGIPSIDHETIHALALCKFYGVEVNFEETNSPWNNCWSLPTLQGNGVKEFSATPKAIIALLKSQGHNFEPPLTKKEESENQAWEQLLEESLVPALLYYLLLDQKNFLDVVRPFYGEHLSWLFKLWYPNHLATEAQNYLKCLYTEAEFEISHCERHIREKAERVLRLISTKIDSKKYFRDGSPSCVDAATYSLLAPILRMPLPFNPLKEFIVKNTPNLEQFVDGISKKYFPSSLPSPTSQAEDVYTPRRKYLTIAAVSSLMVAYAIFTGVVSRGRIKFR